MSEIDRNTGREITCTLLLPTSDPAKSGTASAVDFDLELRLRTCFSLTFSGVPNGSQGGASDCEAGRDADASSDDDDSSEEDLSDFYVSGPRPTAWCMRWLRARRSPLDHHLLWRTTAKLEPSAWGVELHELLLNREAARVGAHHQRRVEQV